MPELPEVETIAQGLRKKIIGQQITQVEILHKRPLANSTPKGFSEFFMGEILQSIQRHGKYIVFTFKSQKKLVSHLRMTGKWIILPQLDSHQNKHTRVIFHLNQPFLLLFKDVRLFGTLKLYQPNEKLTELIKTGPDLLSVEFNADFLYSQLKNKNTPIKNLLLNQKIAAGMGNIYASEALHRAGIHPLKKACKITYAEADHLVKLIKDLMLLAISLNGTSVSDYRNVEDERGDFQKMLLVYQRARQKCLQCGKAKIEKIVMAQRSTFFCPVCQTE